MNYIYCSVLWEKQNLKTSMMFYLLSVYQTATAFAVPAMDELESCLLSVVSSAISDFREKIVFFYSVYSLHAMNLVKDRFNEILTANQIIWLFQVDEAHSFPFPVKET